MIRGFVQVLTLSCIAAYVAEGHRETKKRSGTLFSRDLALKQLFNFGRPFDGPPPTPGYTITLDTSGLGSKFVSAFTVAKDRWEDVVKGDLPSMDVSGLKGYGTFCDIKKVPNPIDDIFMCASTEKIDGKGGILARAGPEAIRSDSSLPYRGIMQFDKADASALLSSGLFADVVVSYFNGIMLCISHIGDTPKLHEMGHLLGIGTVWADLGLTSDCSNYAADSRATFWWKNLTGCATPIPVETDGGKGTRCGHWDEDCLQGELMTGFIDAGAMEFSLMTVGTLSDMGYEVNETAATPFTKEMINPECLCNNNIDGELPMTRRRLQMTKARIEAIADGKHYLGERRQSAARDSNSGDGDGIEGSIFVGGDIVFIVYEEEDGTISSVVVTP